MKKVLLTVATALTVGLLATSCGGGATTNGGKASLKTPADSAAYALGVLNGEGFAKSLATMPGDKIDVDILLNAMSKAMKEQSTQMTSQEAQDFLQDYFPRMVELEKQTNLEEGNKFLEENGKKEGVITTESGLQYKVEEMGSGLQATSPQDTVVVHYRGKLLDGTEFDSSYERDEPATFPLNRVIAGWTEGLQLVPAGSKFTLWIPAELAYGESGAGGAIGPNSTITFDCELMEVKPYVETEE